MHPAYSIILFTTASGAGYGLLFMLCLLGAAGLLPPDRWLGLLGFGLSFVLITGGLLSSTLHLGHPERAWRAISQWRSSWLSREGVFALFTYLPAALAAYGWVVLERSDGVWALANFLAAISAVITVICTAMIYASLPTIRQWHNAWVLPGYLVLALASGSLLLALILVLLGIDQKLVPMIAIAELWGAALVKRGYWKAIDKMDRKLTPADAIGLPEAESVRQLDPPHTQANYVMREMGYQVARTHALKLRRIAVIVGIVVPLVLVLVATPLGGGIFAGLAFVLATAAAALGLVIERWLFFAEAEHVVTLYYGAERA